MTLFIDIHSQPNLMNPGSEQVKDSIQRLTMIHAGSATFGFS